MTAICAYFSMQSRCCFVAADDIEYTTGRKVDKLHLLQERWIIASHGQDITELSINAVTYFQGFDKLDFSKTELVIDHVIRATKGISQRLYPEYLKSHQSGRISRRDHVAAVPATHLGKHRLRRRRPRDGRRRVGQQPAH